MLLNLGALSTHTRFLNYTLHRRLSLQALFGELIVSWSSVGLWNLHIQGSSDVFLGLGHVKVELSLPTGPGW